MQIDPEGTATNVESETTRICIHLGKMDIDQHGATELLKKLANECSVFDEESKRRISKPFMSAMSYIACYHGTTSKLSCNHIDTLYKYIYIMTFLMFDHL